MPKIASIDFPDIGIEEASQIAERVVKEFKGTITIAGLALTLKMSEKGGAFLAKAAGLRAYGLLEGRGELKVTDTAQKIALPQSAEERSQAKRQAFLNVDLFRRLADRLGDSMPDEDRLSIFVEEITRAPRIEVARKIPRLHRLYSEGARYLGAADTSESPITTHADNGSTATAPSPIVERGFVELRTADVQLRVPLNKTSLTLLRAVIDNIEITLVENTQVVEGAG